MLKLRGAIYTPLAIPKQKIQNKITIKIYFQHITLGQEKVSQNKKYKSNLTFTAETWSKDIL